MWGQSFVLSIIYLPLKQMGSSSFHMFIYARSEQCDLGPIYTITNTQRIRIYPGKLKFILVKILPDPGHLHGKQFTCLTTANLSGHPLVHTSANTERERIQICPVML